MNLVISLKTIFTTLAIVLAVWLLIQIETVVLAIFVALILALGLDPLADALCKRGLPRIFSALLIFVVLVAVIITIGTVSFTPMIEQTQRFWERLPQFADMLFGQTYGQRLNDAIFGQLGTITTTSGNVIRFTIDIFSNALSFLTVLIFAFYFLIDFDKMRNHFVELFPAKHQGRVKKTIAEIETNLGRWLRGQVTLMLVVGSMTYIGLTILKIDYALPLALIAGSLEIVPMIGPMVAAVPALLVGFATSFVSGLGVLSLYIIVQQLENNLIVPRVMQKAVGFNPVLTMILLLIGAKLLGVVGALLAVPATLTGYLILKNVILEESNPAE